MKNGPNIGARLRFMVEDVCDFRASGWKPGKGGPKAVLRAAKSAKEPKSDDSAGEKAKSPAKAGGGGGGAGAGGAAAGGAASGGRGGGQKSDSQWKEVSKPNKGQGVAGGGGGASGKQGVKDSPGTKDRKERGGGGGKEGKEGKDGNKRSGGNTDSRRGGDRNSRDGGRKDNKAGAAASPSVSSKKEPSTPIRAEEEEDEVKAEASIEKGSGASSTNERYVPAVHSAIEEYWELNDIEGVIYALEKDFPEDYRSQFIFEAFKHSMMRSEKDRERLLDCIFSPELTEGLFTKAVLRAGIQLAVDALTDLQMDHPAAPRKFAPFVARSINEGVHSFKELWTLFDQHIDEGRGYGVCGEVLGATLKCLIQSSSLEKIKV